MAEAWRKEEPLTTADLAGTKATIGEEARNPVEESIESEADGGPRLVRNELRDGMPGGMVAESASDSETVSTADKVAGRDSSREMTKAASSAPLLSAAELSDLRSKWTDIQAGFVDEPRNSVEQADQLVASAIQRLAEGFARERSSLEKQWESGSDVSTEDLRLALQRYRSFFGRLLNAA
jgi:hypothetical protein